MWDNFKQYEKLLWKLVWKWMSITRNRYTPDELFNELVIVYANSFNTWQTGLEMADWRGKSDEEFRYLLGRTCWAHLCDYVIRKNQTVLVSIDDVIVESQSPEFEELFTRFFFEALETLVVTPHGKEILDLILHNSNKLDEAKQARMDVYRQGRPSAYGRNRKMNKDDLKYYFTKVEGWECQAYQSGMQEVEQAYRQLLVLD